MAVNAESPTSLNGWFKTRYADNAERLVPEFSILPEMFKFKEAKKTGDTYQVTCRVRRQFGWTFNGGANAGTAFALDEAVPGKTVPANISGTEFIARAQIPYGVIKRARTSEQAFGNAFDELVLDMTEGAHFAREMNLLYGGSNIGVVDSAAAMGGVAGAYTRDIVIEAADWAPGLWAQMEGARIDVYTALGVVVVGKANDIVATVTAVDPDTRTVTITTDEAAPGTQTAAIAATDVLLPYGAFGNWFLGVHETAQNTGLMHGINAATYSLWKGNTYSAGGAAATMAKFTKAVVKSVVRGGLGEVTFLVSTATWADLNNDHAALRRFAESTKGSLDLGTNQITYYGPNGTIKITPHPMVKEGYAYGLQTNRWERVGSTDLTFNLGVDGSQERFIQELGENAGVEIRCYWDQALLCRAPARQVVMTNIVNVA